MSKSIIVCLFGDEQDILNATRSARQSGYPILDVYTPFALHGMDEAMGLKPSRLPIVCFLFGLLGAAAKLYFQYWASAASWAIDVGGKPWNSLPAFVPITFEIMVLIGGLGTVATFLIRSRLYLGKKPNLPHISVTDNRFALVLDGNCADISMTNAEEFFEKYHVLSVDERFPEES